MRWIYWTGIIVGIINVAIFAPWIFGIFLIYIGLEELGFLGNDNASKEMK